MDSAPSGLPCRGRIDRSAAKARGLYIDSFIPPDRLEAAYVHENIARVRAAAACAIKAGAKIVSLGGFSSILIEGNFDQLPEKTRYGLHHRQYVDRWFHRSGHQEDVRAGGSEPPQLDAADRWSDRRCGFRLRALFSASGEARAAQRTQRGAATQARRGVARPMEFRWRSRQVYSNFPPRLTS